MLIFTIDDEPKSCKLLRRTVEEAAPEAEVMSFPGGLEAIEAIHTQKLTPAVIFSDIVMPELDGLELAVRLKTAAPDAKLVFVTGYSDYAVHAFQLHASGYIIKPADTERIREELAHLSAPNPFERDDASEQPSETDSAEGQPSAPTPSERDDTSESTSETDPDVPLPSDSDQAEETQPPAETGGGAGIPILPPDIFP